MNFESWDACVTRYERLKQSEHWSKLAAAMLTLIERIRKDRTFPVTVHTVSHGWLRIGPVSDDPTYRPGVWVGWRAPNYYWIGVGSFGTRNRVTVSADKAVMMLKRYLQNLKNIDPAYRQFAASHTDTEDWTRERLMERFNTLELESVAPKLRETVSAQLTEARGYVEQLHSIVDGFETQANAQELLDGVLERLDRVLNSVEIGLGRYMPEPKSPAPQDTAQNPPTTAAPSNGTSPEALHTA
jgi:hypothetical protein